MSMRARFARRLESDGRPGLPSRVLACAWSAMSARAIARPLRLAPAIRAIGVGGASLGGSYKTPFAIALAKALATRGMDVALVGHAYRARPTRARVVRPDDDVTEVGDDALFAARRLRGTGVEVIVGPSRQSAATFAGQRARCLVFDGLLQTHPARLARSILLLDGARSLRHRHCPPAGDLRAPLPALLRAADLAVTVRDELVRDALVRDELTCPDSLPALDRIAWTDERMVADAGPGDQEIDAVSHLDRALFPDGRAIALPELRDAAIGLVVAIAHPARVAKALARRGFPPAAILAFPDHHRPTAAELAAASATTTRRIDAWLTTGKCATKLPGALAGAPILVLEHEVRLSDRLIAWVASDAPPDTAGFPLASVDALFPSAGGVG